MTDSNRLIVEMPGSLNNVDAFYCRKCGCTGKKNFSWDGNCLVCEDGLDDNLGEDCGQSNDALKFAMALEEERHIWGPRDEDGELK